MTKPAKPKAQAPTGRNNSAQGNALGHVAPQNKSPEGAAQMAQEWQWKSLVDVAEEGVPILYGILQPGPEDPKGVLYVRPTEIVEDVIDLASVRRTTPAIAAKYKRSTLRGDDIILSIVGTIGKVAVVPPELEGGNITQSSVRIRPRIGIVTPRFLAWTLRSPVLRNQFNNLRLGTAVPRLNVAQVRELRVPVPPLAHQRRIVAEIEKQFTRLEAGVAALRRVQANLKRYRAAVLKAACEGRLVPAEAELARAEGRPFESGQQLLARILTERRQNWQGRGKYKEPASLSASGYEPESLPEGWGRSSIAQVAFLDVGFAFKSAEFEKSGIRLLRGENLEPGRMRWADTRYWPESKLPDVEHLLIREGEIVLAMDRPLISSGLKIARARKHDLPCLLVQRMARLRSVVESMTPFLFMVMNTQGFIKHLLGGQTGTQLPHISGEGIQSFDFPLPPLAEQTRIVAEVERRLSVVEELEAVVTTSLQRATRLRQSVLQKAFTGGLAP